MNQAVGGYISKKDGTALCVHCINDQVQKHYLAIGESSLSDSLKCSKCERKLIDALHADPPPLPPKEPEKQLPLSEDTGPGVHIDKDGFMSLGMPDVFTPDDPVEAKKHRIKGAKKARRTNDGDS